jgi:hypothetical protein
MDSEKGCARGLPCGAWHHSKLAVGCKDGIRGTTPGELRRPPTTGIAELSPECSI